MLCLSGFELYSRWVPLKISLFLLLSWRRERTGVEGHEGDKLIES